MNNAATPAYSISALVAQVGAIVRGTWRRRWIGLAAAWIAALLGAVALMSVPDRYEANAQVFVDTKTVLKPLMRDLAVEPEVGQTIAMLARTLITRPKIESLLQKSGLEGGVTAEKRDLAIDRMMRDIRLEGGGRDNVYTFTYRDTDPRRARLVVQNLVSLFAETDRGAKNRDTASARDFIDEQIKAYEVRLTEAENRLKNFKLSNMELSDPSGKDYLSRISLLTDELARQTVELRAAEQSRDALRRELKGEELPVLVPQTPGGLDGPIVSSPELDARLDTQRKLLDDLLRRFTDLHPDVLTTRRLITRLEEQKRQEDDLRRKALEAAPKRAGAPLDQAARSIKLALAESEANVAGLRTRVSETQTRLGQMRAAANRVPQVEAELAQLNRDYDVVRRNYEALVGRREKASISEDMDASSGGAQFHVIEPPRVAERPVFPNRLGLAPWVLGLALVMGAAASFIASQLMPTFDTADSLRAVLRRPILGSVSMIATSRSVRRARRATMAFSSGLCGLFLVSGTWIAWLAMQARA